MTSELSCLFLCTHLYLNHFNTCSPTANNDLVLPFHPSALPFIFNSFYCAYEHGVFEQGTFKNGVVETGVVETGVVEPDVVLPGPTLSLCRATRRWSRAALSRQLTS